ncbi:hypothetical protein [Polaribacter aquimarinus]|uniref:tRNA (Guanine-N1)-methyltransferase n=1 Tax=Polaribacter aquimarinus TaxID=2100726 RepID=A0A2U2J791_9FLAO|nr:hypothetical protein [Polaribacter aquimarinus]PWG04206.1 hypothetical protein DIS07_14700 [Polaribacter aquimarinus]
MRLHLLILFFFVSSITFGQQAIEDKNKTIEGQFNKVYRTSTTYNPKDTPKRYKVINIKSYEDLKSNILDSITIYRELISKKESLLKTERENIEKIKTKLSKTQLDLKIANQKENSISLLGIELSKTTYNILLWGIIIILIISLLYFIFKFFRSNILTKEAQGNLINVEEEFEQHRKKSLEREQKLRRQLQDEINKQRNA